MSEVKRHIHADLIIAWANGAEIEMAIHSSENWGYSLHPSWSSNLRYRIKPIPKPDVVSYAHVKGKCANRRPTIVVSSSNNWNIDNRLSYTAPANVKFTWDGETGDLKNAEVF